MQADDRLLPAVARRAEEIAIEDGRRLTRAVILKRREMHEFLGGAAASPLYRNFCTRLPGRTSAVYKFPFESTVMK